MAAARFRTPPLLLEFGIPCVMEPVLVARPLRLWVMDVTLVTAGVPPHSNEGSVVWFCWDVDCCCCCCCCRCNRWRW
jgi:hypothetical protein